MKYDYNFLSECFNYNPETGEVFWNTDRPKTHFKTEKGYNLWKTRCSGKVAGRLNPQGYVSVAMKLDGKLTQILLHRVAWALHHKKTPCGELHIDHINWNRTDNRISNIRLVTPEENLKHTDPSKLKPKTPRKSQKRQGVAWQKNTNRWRAYTYGSAKSRLVIGHYKEKFDAVIAHLNAMKYPETFKKPNLPYCKCR